MNHSTSLHSRLHLVALSAVALAAFGCEQLRPDPLPPPRCVETRTACSAETCCAGAFCESGPYMPDFGTCVAQRADGEFCLNAFECTSGVCTDNHCGAVACASTGEACGDGATCCAGTFCDPQVYAPERQRCVPQLADGEVCSDARECASGTCSNNRCGVPACIEAGAECGTEGCCAGSFCETNAYVETFNHCVPQLPDGEICVRAEECQGGACTDHRCGGVIPNGPVTFLRVYEEVLVPNGCTNGYCHGGNAGSLQLGNPEVAYWNLVGMPPAGAGCSAPARVSPGSLEGSLLWSKVAPGLAVCGSKMPPNRGALPSASLELLRAWILQGAPN